MQFTINGEQADTLAELFAEQAARADESIGSVTFTKQGLDATLVVAFDERTFEISGGGTPEEI
jgi:hypothetical protein